MPPGYSWVPGDEQQSLPGAQCDRDRRLKAMIGDPFLAPSTSPGLGIEAGRARSDRLPLLVLGALVACGLVVALTVARTRELLPGSIRISTPDYLAGAFAHSGVNVGFSG